MDNFFNTDTQMDDFILPDLYDLEDTNTDTSFAAIPQGSGNYQADEACIRCKNEFSRVDLGYMSRISGLTKDELINALQGTAIFQSPAVCYASSDPDPYEGWLYAEQYLCGNIPDKLQEAEEMNLRFPNRFKANVQALSRLMPKRVYIDDIHIALGAPWIPADIYEDFIRELLNPWQYPEVIYNSELALWKIDCSMDKGSVLNKFTYGTQEMGAIKIIERTMNAKPIKIFEYIPVSSSKTEPVLNKAATLAAQEKQSMILQKWDSFIRADNRRRKRLEEAYNDTFVGYSYTPYDGSFLSFPDMNPAIRTSLYTHQRNAIARILLSDTNILLSHGVGTGKTYVMIAAVHEIKRMGLSSKNLIVVPNNVLGATIEAHRKLYPEDKILEIYPRNFTPDKRDHILQCIRDNDYTVIYMAYSSFDMLKMSKNYYIEQARQELQDLKLGKSNARSRMEECLLDSKIERQKKHIQKLYEELEDTSWLPFDYLGIDTMFVDEAHNYKNIDLDTYVESVVGMHNNGSKKCREMKEKCNFTKRVIFATGTPLTNSLADLYVMQTYLQPEDLALRHLDSFDMWINTFGERETLYEVDIDSQHVRSMVRFSRFHNLPELMAMFRSVCDFFMEEIDDATLPQNRNREDICVSKNAEQSEYISELAERTDMVRHRHVPRTEDNLLKITTDGRRCALDIRLVCPDMQKLTNPTPQNNKIMACAQMIYKLYQEYPDTCQAVMSDIGTPKGAFNVYDELRLQLEILGIPENEIAYIHDAGSERAKDILTKSVNSAKIRVIIGSTQKLGVGLNIQESLVALHHLSIPWRPADMQQREGRIIRQGNTCNTIYIYRYITTGTFDSFSYQILENKQRFISSFLSGVSQMRDADDIADAVLSYAEAKALAIGDSRIKIRVELANKLERTKIAKRRRHTTLLDLRSVVKRFSQQIINLETDRNQVEADLQYYISQKESIPQVERIAFGEELLEALKDNVMREQERIFDSYQGFSVILPAKMPENAPFILLDSHLAPDSRHRVELKDATPYGCSKRLDACLERLEKRNTELTQRIELAKQHRREADIDLSKGNPYEKQVETLIEELAEIDRQLAESEVHIA